MLCTYGVIMMVCIVGHRQTWRPCPFLNSVPAVSTRFGDVSEANGPIFTSADLIDAYAYKMPSCSTAREYAYWGHQTVERWRGGSSSIACTWCHGGHVGGEEKKHFSPLATLFSCKFFKKKLFCIDLQHGRLTTWLQTKKIPLELTKDRRLKDKSPYQRRTNLGFY